MTERAVVMTKPSSRVACGPIVGNMQPTPVFYPRGYFPPVSNTERQRQFRERNPGYYARIQAKKRAASKAHVAAIRAAERAAAAMLAKSRQLMLPAPVELPVIPGMNAIPDTLPELRELEPLRVSHASVHSPHQSLAA